MQNITGELLIFDVELGQCIFYHPKGDINYTLMIDCGHNSSLASYPIDMLLNNGWLQYDVSKQKYIIKDLTLTNYDFDHFSAISDLHKKVHIDTVLFPSNLNVVDLKVIKNPNDHTKHVFDTLYYIKDSYNSPAASFSPPYFKKIFLLPKYYQKNTQDTNNLSQVVFVTDASGITFCVPGDIEKHGWENLLLVYGNELISYLNQTHLFFASHHGRENGYYEALFNYLNPGCIVISDKSIVHGTQEDMSSLYGSHVTNGVIFNNENRQVLTTRNDGNIRIKFFNTNGQPTWEFSSFSL